MTNAEVQTALVEKVIQNWLSPVCGANLVVGRLRTNYYSFTFSVEIQTSEGSKGAFVKIPKSDLRVGSGQIMPLSDADRQMAGQEARSLRHLGEVWRGDDLRVRWVQLLGEIPEFNALVTAKVAMGEAFEMMRTADLRRRAGATAGIVGIRDAMRRLGTGLGRFHQRDAATTPFVPAASCAKLLHCAAEVGRVSQSEWLSHVGDWLHRLGDAELPSAVTTTLKGIDVRNVLLSEAGDVTLLDPGRMKRTFREADLARFLVTYRILHWGRPWFALGWKPDPESELAFLAGYASAGEAPSGRVLRVYLVKELLKHWHTAHASLATKAWPAPVKRIVRSGYIDAFYERQLADELRSPL